MQDASVDKIVIISSRERVERGLKIATLLGSTAIGFAVAAMSSPVVMGCGAAALLVLSLGRCVRLPYAFQNMKSPTGYDNHPLVADLQDELAQNYTLLHKNKSFTAPVVVLPGEILGGGRTQYNGHQGIVIISDYLLYPGHRRFASWILTHEASHAARSDYEVEASSRLAGLTFCFMACATPAVAPALAWVLVPGAVAALPWLCGQLKKDREGNPHQAEFECERIAATLHGRPSQPNYGYGITPTQMANHCAAYDVPPPAHLPSPERTPGRLIRMYNRLCRILIPPVAVPMPAPRPWSYRP